MLRRFMALALLLGGSGLALASEVPRPFYGVVAFECSPLAGGSVTVQNTRTAETLQATTASDGSWSVDLPDSFVNGDPVTVTASKSGATGSASTTVAGGIQRAPDILLQEPPLLTISQPAYGFRTTAAAVDVAGVADGTGSAPQLYINGAQVSVAADNSFLTSVSLAVVGENWVNATLLDCLGSQASQSILVHRDAAPGPSPSPTAAGGGRGGGAPSSPAAATAPRAAVLSLGVEPATVLAGKTAVVTATVRNDGGAGEASLTLLVNGTPAETRTVSLAAGETRSVAFFLTPARAGTANLSVESATAKLAVVQSLPQATILPAGTTPLPSPAASPNATAAPRGDATPTPAPVVPTQPRASPKPTPGMEAGLAAAALGLAAVASARRRRGP